MAPDQPLFGSQHGAGRWFRDLSPSPPPPLPHPWKAPPCQTQIFDWTLAQSVMRRGEYTSVAFPTVRRSTPNPPTWRLTKELIQVNHPWSLELYFLNCFYFCPFLFHLDFWNFKILKWTYKMVQFLKINLSFNLVKSCFLRVVFSLTNEKYKPFQIMTEYKTFNFLAEVCVFVSSFQGKDLWNLSILFMEVRNLNYLLTWVYFLVLDSSRGLK